MNPPVTFHYQNFANTSFIVERFVIVKMKQKIKKDQIANNKNYS